jgi:protein required for attachment to host cells
MRNVRTRILVADQSEARFYDLERGSPMQIAGRLLNPDAHLHDRDLKSDRPGRVFSRAATPGTRRGASARHATGGENSPRKRVALLFARQIGGELDRARRAGRFDRLVVMAGPQFLGVLRTALPSALRKVTVAEVGRDLVHQSERVLRAHLPPEALAPAIRTS